MLAKIPNGISEIIEVYGSIDDPKFELKKIVTFDLPYTLFYDGKPVTHTRAHVLAVDNFVQAFKNVQAAGLAKELTEFNGIYAKRSIRGQSHASLHSWGVAIDLCASKFPLGSLKRMPDAIIEAFKSAGFSYGGNFEHRKDPMHFQLATGY